MKGRGKREIPEKSRRPTASSGTIPTCENPVTRPGSESGSPWWEASELITEPPLLLRGMFLCLCVAVLFDRAEAALQVGLDPSDSRPEEVAEVRRRAFVAKLANITALESAYITLVLCGSDEHVSHLPGRPDRLRHFITHIHRRGEPLLATLSHTARPGTQTTGALVSGLSVNFCFSFRALLARGLAEPDTAWSSCPPRHRRRLPATTLILQSSNVVRVRRNTEKRLARVTQASFIGVAKELPSYTRFWINRNLKIEPWPEGTFETTISRASGDTSHQSPLLEHFPSRRGAPSSVASVVRQTDVVGWRMEPLHYSLNLRVPGTNKSKTRNSCTRSSESADREPTYADRAALTAPTSTWMTLRLYQVLAVANSRIVHAKITTLGGGGGESLSRRPACPMCSLISGVGASCGQDERLLDPADLRVTTRFPPPPTTPAHADRAAKQWHWQDPIPRLSPHQQLAPADIGEKCRYALLPTPVCVTSLSGTLQLHSPRPAITTQRLLLSPLRDAVSTSGSSTWRLAYDGKSWVRVDSGSGETRDPRENPPTSVIARHDPHVRKSREQPRRQSNPVRLGGGRAVWPPHHRGPA
ncbi:hypothetical protein PR048_004377 [Dryococelus australis]|uniref:Uncharacterized protein n=1 Tax=Dryococelus australis TaxID=614101 RepID=A0ABQ9I597_9NEOP|nr:hypothetical protein PR048_004377 [Dryococelus australis]